MKILLPACFIALKLTGSFIDFMLGLANSNVQEDIDIVTSYETVVEDLLSLSGSSAVVDFLVSKGTNSLKNLFGKQTVESFKFRTCVKPILSVNRLGETEIVYESLTAQDLLPKET